MRAIAMLLCLSVLFACGDSPDEGGERDSGPSPNRASGRLAVRHMKALSQAMEFYRLQHARYPQSLSDLTEPDDDFPDGYLAGGVVPKDPWDEEYIYEGSRGSFTLRSSGPDRIDGTEDDITRDSE